ncbi:MAG: DUF559 domain-containing protein [Firmicutes bacterium]|nr:DUF559 domain-containing protein [Bacillota bacterium]
MFDWGRQQAGRPTTEVLLEKALIKAGIKHRANTNIPPYEVDFLVEPYVVIEVDGYMHALQGVQDKDRGKTQHLECLGYAVLRFTGDEVRYNAKTCIRKPQLAQKRQRERHGNHRPIEQLAPWQQQLYSSYVGTTDKAL